MEEDYATESDWQWEDRDPRWVWRPLIGALLAAAALIAARLWFHDRFPDELMLRIAYAAGAALAVFAVFYFLFFHKAYIVLKLLALLIVAGIATVAVLGTVDPQLAVARDHLLELKARYG